ncbi:hypothetical protein MNEG_14188, partial [Monoraphidium neglectum]
GNAPEELPEHIIGASRLYRVDFERCGKLEEYAAAAAAPSLPLGPPPGPPPDAGSLAAGEAAAAAQAP